MKVMWWKNNKNMKVRKNYDSNPSKSNAEKMEEKMAAIKAVPCIFIKQKETFIGNQNELYSNSFIGPSMNANGKYVGYSLVTEKQIDTRGLNSLGKTVFKFTNNADPGSPSNGVGNSYFSKVKIPFTLYFPKMDF